MDILNLEDTSREQLVPVMDGAKLVIERRALEEGVRALHPSISVDSTY